MLLKTLKNVYDNSNFYKEARIVSFIDRLLVCIQTKLKSHCSMGLALLSGSTGNGSKMLQTIDEAQLILKKFNENFFIRELIAESKEKKSEAITEEQKQMD